MDDDTITSDQLTIDYSSLSYTIPPLTAGAVGSLYSTSNTHYGNVTINTTAGFNGTSGSYWTSNGGIGNSVWTTNAGGSTGNVTSAGLHVSSDAEFEGDIKWKGRSLGKLLEKIEDRLAILAEPDPAKLEKYAALKKAYEHYKLMEKLIGDE